MRLLILGGTVFLGRALTGAAIARGHDVTHLNRGKSAPDDARVRSIHADRTDEQALATAIGEASWDAAIDTSGYLPQVVRKSAALLRERVARYHFVSSISAYASHAPLLRMSITWNRRSLLGIRHFSRARRRNQWISPVERCVFRSLPGRRTA